MNKKALILLSTYNGEKYLSEQVESLENQENALLDILRIWVLRRASGISLRMLKVTTITVFVIRMIYGLVIR